MYKMRILQSNRLNINHSIRWYSKNIAKVLDERGMLQDIFPKHNVSDRNVDHLDFSLYFNYIPAP